MAELEIPNPRLDELLGLHASIVEICDPDTDGTSPLKKIEAEFLRHYAIEGHDEETIATEMGNTLSYITSLRSRTARALALLTPNGVNPKELISSLRPNNRLSEGEVELLRQGKVKIVLEAAITGMRPSPEGIHEGELLALHAAFIESEPIRYFARRIGIAEGTVASWKVGGVAGLTKWLSPYGITRDEILEELSKLRIDQDPRGPNAGMVRLLQNSDSLRGFIEQELASGGERFYDSERLDTVMRTFFLLSGDVEAITEKLGCSEEYAKSMIREGRKHVVRVLSEYSVSESEVAASLDAIRDSTFRGRPKNGVEEEPEPPRELPPVAPIAPSKLLWHTGKASDEFTERVRDELVRWRTSLNDRQHRAPDQLTLSRLEELADKPRALAPYESKILLDAASSYPLETIYLLGRGFRSAPYQNPTNAEREQERKFRNLVDSGIWGELMRRSLGQLVQLCEQELPVVKLIATVLTDKDNTRPKARLSLDSLTVLLPVQVRDIFEGMINRGLAPPLVRNSPEYKKTLQFQLGVHAEYGYEFRGQNLFDIRQRALDLNDLASLILDTKKRGPSYSVSSKSLTILPEVAPLEFLSTLGAMDRSQGKIANFTHQDLAKWCRNALGEAVMKEANEEIEWLRKEPQKPIFPLPRSPSPGAPKNVKAST